MGKTVKSIKKKLVIMGLIFCLTPLLLVGCVMVVFMGHTMSAQILPSGYLEFIQEYKNIGEATGVDWADMVIYDTVRYDNDFEKADPQETVYEFLMMHFIERRRELECIGEDEEGNCLGKEVNYNTVEDKIYHGKYSILDRLIREGARLPNGDIYGVVDYVRALNGHYPEFEITLYGKDIEDLLENFNGEQREWADILISENYVHEMFSDLLGIPWHIPSLGNGYFAWPTPTLQSVTSPYGWRVHPVTKERSFHYGVDIAGPNAQGQPIIAVADGVVIQVVTNSVAGKNIRIKHIDEEGIEWQSRYCHMAEMYVSPGRHVQKGDVIGTVGNTGRSTGPHLHFELKIGGQLVDPYPYIRQRGADE